MAAAKIAVVVVAAAAAELPTPSARAAVAAVVVAGVPETLQPRAGLAVTPKLLGLLLTAMPRLRWYRLPRLWLWRK